MRIKILLFQFFRLVLIGLTIISTAEMNTFFSLKRSFFNLHRTTKKICARFFHKSTLSKQKSASIDFKQNQSIYPLFSRSTDLGKALCALINNEQNHIMISTYMLTDYTIIAALCHAKKRGVKIEVVVDQQSLSINNLDKLKQHDIPIFVHKSKNSTRKMHHKIALFSQNNILGALYNLVWLGSYNFTFSGSKKNFESVIVTCNNKKIFSECEAEFQSIQKESAS